MTHTHNARVGIEGRPSNLNAHVLSMMQERLRWNVHVAQTCHAFRTVLVLVSVFFLLHEVLLSEAAFSGFGVLEGFIPEWRVFFDTTTRYEDP